jgi:hypothetical protein
MALFAVAMVGLATAQDLVLVFVFFDLTAVCSYFLIGFDRSERAARTAALTALLVTVVAAVLLYEVGAGPPARGRAGAGRRDVGRPGGRHLAHRRHPRRPTLVGPSSAAPGLVEVPIPRTGPVPAAAWAVRVGFGRGTDHRSDDEGDRDGGRPPG